MWSLALLQIKQTLWRMMIDRKDTEDSQIRDEKAWTARITQIWYRIQKKIMKIVMIEEVRENYSNSNVNLRILKLTQNLHLHNIRPQILRNMELRYKVIYWWKILRMPRQKDASIPNRDTARKGPEVLDQPTCGVVQIIIHTLLELKATAHTKLIKSIENHKIQPQRILCNKKEAALRVSTKTMVPTDLQVSLELSAAETQELPRWSTVGRLVEPQTIYKTKQIVAET